MRDISRSGADAVAACYASNLQVGVTEAGEVGPTESGATTAAYFCLASVTFAFGFVLEVWPHVGKEPWPRKPYSLLPEEVFLLGLLTIPP